MLTPSERSRYSRHLLLPELGEEGQLRLRNGSVVIIGAGGLGSPAAMYLAAAGVGRIGIVDFDKVDATNLHRQILYDTDDVGQSKVEKARERLAAMNTDIAIETHETPLTSENALEILGRYDVIVDGTDNLPTRYLTNDAAILLGKPLVYGSIFRFEGQVSVFDATRGPCYRCLYPVPPPPEAIPSCAEAGVIGVLPGVIGTLQALEAIKLIAGIGETLIGRLLLFDALRLSFRQVRLKKNCDAHEPVTRLIDYEGFCTPMNEREITPAQLAERISKGDDLILLDVREPYEWQVGHHADAVHIPMQQVASRLAELPRDREIVVICRSGSRSATVQEFLLRSGYHAVKNLRGGMKAWAKDVDRTMNVA